MRKIPRQARARQTVEYILEAAACILAERGLEGFTTNHIAERAGVNISSLYQYFPDKLAILEALRERHVAVPDENYALWLERSRDLPLEDIVHRIVDLAISMHATNPAMHKLFLEALPRQSAKGDDRFETERIARMAAILLGHCRTSANPEMMLFILRHTLTQVLHEAVCERPEWLKDPAFREELVTLLVNYLKA